jgi:hypothetical protein
MQAILPKYLGPTNTRGSRVSAQAQAGRVTIGWDDALNSDENHRAAATALLAKQGWADRSIVGGCLPSGDHCWVFLPKEGA